jgi:tyrocidine synthetase-3
LAHVLREKGVGLDTIVGIKMERSIELIIGLLGILKAGGAYLPIDQEYPQERLNYMLADSRAKALVTNSMLDFSTLPFSQPHLSPAPATSLAYIIYTSGSTGRPKGVLVQHQNVVRLVKNSNFIDFTPADRLLLTGAVGFDISTFEIWWPLLNGLTLFLVNQHVILDADRLGNFMIKNKISILHLIPGLFNQLAFQRLGIFAGLTYFLVGGDLVQPQYINLLRNTCKDIKILHMYGPTENTTFSTFHRVNQDYDTLIPIGKPIGNSFVYIVDKFDKLAPIGVPGELLLGGEGVARGYLNKPGLTNDKFLIINYKLKTEMTHELHELTRIGPTPNKKLLRMLHGSPDASRGGFLEKSPPGRRRQKIYKTGDLGRWLSDGNIEFLGRKDQQVKIRGYRVEVGEIESRLLDHPQVKETVVTLSEVEKGDKSLVAYIVPDPTDLSIIDELRHYLSQKIPGFMIPSYFILLDKIPLTANGKADLKALPPPGTGEPGEIEAGPRGLIERKLVNIWAEVLKVSPSQIGIDSNFFELGGHSLKAAQLMAKIQTRFNTVLSLQEIFKFPTIRQLGSVVSTAETSTITRPNVEKQEYYEVSYNQERLWNFQHLNPGSDAYNICRKISFNRDIHVKGVRETLFKLIRRHESFRTRFGEVNGQPVQFIETNVTIPLEIIDLSFLQEEKKEFEAQKIYKENCRKSFDLTCAPLFRGVVLKLGTGCWDFIFVMHHIIYDGWSHELLKKEFLAFYHGFQAGKDITLPTLQFRYMDFALWQRRRSSDPSAREEVLNYWRNKFEKGFPVLQLPFDRNGDPNDRSGITFRSVVPPGIKKSLQLLGETHHTSLFMILFSAFNRLLSTISGQGDIVCRVPAASRDQPAVQAIMGYLVNHVILKNQVKDNERFTDLLHRVTENTLEAFRYQWYPFEQVLENLGREYPCITVSLNMLTMQESEAETDLEQWDSFFTEDTGDVKLPLNLRVTLYRNGIEIIWNAQKSLFKPATLEKMARQYVRVLKKISKENQHS